MRPEIRRTTYRVFYADRRQATLDGDELEQAIRAGSITAEDWVALPDGIQRRYWDFPRFSAFSPFRHSSVAAHTELPPQAAPGGAFAPPPVRNPVPRSHVSATPVAASTVAAVAASVERTPVIDAVPMTAEERRVDEVMSRLGEVRQRMASRPHSGAVAPVPSRASGAVAAVAPRSVATPAPAPLPTQRPPSTSSHNAAVPNKRTSAAVRPVAGSRGPSQAELDLAAAAIEEVDKHAPLFERKYAASRGAASVTDGLDVANSLEDALREAESGKRRPTGLVAMPKASERSKAVLAVVLLAIAAFLIVRLLNQ